MKFKIPTIDNSDFKIQFELEKPSIFIGANGAGKTRLSVYISEQIQQIQQKILNCQPAIDKLNQEKWKEDMPDEEIERQFIECNSQNLPFQHDSGEMENLNLYEIVNLLLKKKGGEGFQFFSTTLLVRPPININDIEGGIIVSPQLYSINIDVELLKYAEKYKKNKSKAIHSYRAYKLQKSKAAKKSSITDKLGEVQFEKSYRISAHRGLTLKTDLSPMNSEQALLALLNLSGKYSDNKPITGMQNDFTQLLSALYSEEAELSSDYTESVRKGEKTKIPNSSLSQLIKFWNEILSQRSLSLKKLNIEVRIKPNQASYSPSEMSDGERNIFYILGQCLLAPKNSLLIIDEPELHINKAISENFWNYIQEKRQDCGFLFITHDIDFILAQSNANKYLINEYQHSNLWNIKNIEDDLEEVKVKILGSRKNVLFVEGDKRNSLDIVIYEKVYPDYMVIPVGSCEKVKSYVKSLKGNPNFHHLRYFGIIDRDNLTDKQVADLKNDDIYVLNFAGIENIFLMPDIAKLMVEQSGGSSFNKDQMIIKIFKYVKKPANKENYLFKKIKAITELNFLNQINSAKKTEDIDCIKINSTDIKQTIINEFDIICTNEDINMLLKKYTNKGLYKIIIKDLLNAQDVDLKIKGLLRDQKIINEINKHCPQINA